MWEFIKQGVFLQYDQEALAAYILYKARKDLKVSEVWNWHIEFYTHINGERLKEILDSFENLESSKMLSPHVRHNQFLSFGSARVLAVSNAPR